MIPKIEYKFGKLNTFSFWISYVFKRWYYYILGFVFILLTNLTEIIVPKWIQYFIDFLEKGEIPKYINENSPLLSFSLIFLILLVTQTIFRGLWRITLARESHISSSLFKKLIWQRVRFYPLNLLERRFTVGNLMNIATSDVSTARFLFGFTLVGLANSVFLAPLSLYFMYSIDKEITVYTVLCFLILPFIIYRLTDKYSKQYETAQEELGKLNDKSSSSIANVKLQKLSGSATYWFKELLSKASSTKDAKYTSMKTAILFGVVFELAPLIAYIFLFTLGINKLFADQISIGEFVALQSYVFLLQVPFADIGFIIADFKKGTTSIRRLIRVLNNDLDERFFAQEKTDNGYKESVYHVKNLSYSIDETEIIHNLSFEVKKGQWLGIKGPVGSGKSTLIKLLLGFNKDYQGHIYLFDKEIHHYSMKELRNLISYVPQQNFLFADTIENNLRLQSGIDSEKVIEYLKIVQMWEDISNLPDKEKSYLGEHGVNLSGGQQQRLSIARALAQEKPIIIMDDCLSAVDTLTEEQILQELKDKLEDYTIIWTAHRDSTLKYCDQILELN